jgi:hypothetical protein
MGKACPYPTHQVLGGALFPIPAGTSFGAAPSYGETSGYVLVS